VGRIAPQQKGIELIYDFIKETEPTNYQFILLGTGDKEWENQMKTLEITGEKEKCVVRF
jgi:glycogen synthase